MSHITIPVTGTGDATPEVATDLVAGTHYQYMKIVDGTVGGSQPATVDALGNLRVSVAAATALVGASISNLPAVQPVSIASITGGGLVLGASISGGYLGASVAGGYVGASVPNFPATQQTLGYHGASIANLPANQQVTLASTTVTQPISGGVTASVAGYLGASVTNFPATQQVMGLVGASIANTPTVTLASSTIQVGVSIANYPVNVGSMSAFIASTYPGTYVGASIAGGAVAASTVNFGGSTTSYPAAAAIGGASPYHYVSGASVNQTNVKTTAGTVYTLAAMNQNVSQRYLRLYDKATVPSPGADLPVQTYMIPGASAGAGAVIPLPVGLLFANGIGFAITGQIGDLDATAVGASDVVVNLAFK